VGRPFFLRLTRRTVVRMSVATPPAAPLPQLRLAAVQATGPRAELDRLQALASASGIPARQMLGPEGTEVMVAFPSKLPDKAVAAFLTKVRKGGFSGLHFHPIVAPPR
jgi:hypothetical protein